MSDKIIQLNEDLIKHDLKDLVRNSVEETLNALLDKEADELVNAEKYERSSNRQGYRSGYYKRKLHTTAREVEPEVSKLKEDCESWRLFFIWLKECGLTGVRLIIGDKNLGMLETIPEVFPDARYQRCTVHFYRNVFSVTPRNKMKTVALMLKAIHAQESKEAAREKAIQVAEKLRAMKLAKVARKVEDGIEETLTSMDFPTQH